MSYIHTNGSLAPKHDVRQFTFDNDNKHNNPYILGMTNDGTLAYDHQKDGSTQQLAGCLRDFRNKPFPVKARITYYQNTLTVNIQK